MEANPYTRLCHLPLYHQSDRLLCETKVLEALIPVEHQHHSLYIHHFPFHSADIPIIRVTLLK